MAMREGRWDCTQCGSTNIRGGQMSCPGCGRKRTPDTKFYPGEGAPVISDPTEIFRAKLGPDWYCLHCESANRADRNDCSQCGAEKGSSPSHKTRDYNKDEIPRSSEEVEEFEDVIDSDYSYDAFERKNNYEKRYNFEDEDSNSSDDDFSKTEESIDSMFEGISYDSTWHRWDDLEVSETKVSRMFSFIFPPAKVIYAGLLILIIGILIFMNFATKDVEIIAKNHSWSRSVSTEHYVQVSEEGWNLPSGAYNVRNEERIHHYEKVQVGTRTESHEESYQEQTGTETVQTGTEDVQVGSETVVIGQRDCGNGYFEDITETRPVYESRPVYGERPVYETKYRTVTEEVPVYEDQPRYGTYYWYDIMKWVHYRVYKEAELDKKPFWPEYELEENERVSYKDEEYIVYFIDYEGKDFQKEFPFNRWNEIKKDQKFIGKINYFGRLLEIEGL